METELLELDATKVMNIRRVAFHFLELEFNLGLREHVLLIDADDPRSLLELPRPAAPARPNAQTQIIDRQRRRGNDVEHADQRIHAVEFATDVFAKDAALEVGQ